MRKITIIGALIVLINGSCFSQNDSFYYNKGKKVNIDINEEMFYVLMSDSTDILNFFSNSDFNVKVKKSGFHKYKEENRYWKIV